MPFFRMSLLTILALHLVACATIINGSTEKVKILANVSDTQVYVNDVYLGVAGPEYPLEVTVPKKGDVRFVGKKEKCGDVGKDLTRKFDPATLLGLILDAGLISILVVDVFGTGAALHADQPIYFLSMKCSS